MTVTFFVEGESNLQADDDTRSWNCTMSTASRIIEECLNIPLDDCGILDPEKIRDRILTLAANSTDCSSIPGHLFYKFLKLMSVASLAIALNKKISYG